MEKWILYDSKNDSEHINHWKHRAETAEQERDVWRELVAMLCGDGGHYLVKHGMEQTAKHCEDVFWATAERAETAERRLELLSGIVGMAKTTAKCVNNVQSVKLLTTILAEYQRRSEEK